MQKGGGEEGERKEMVENRKGGGKEGRE